MAKLGEAKVVIRASLGPLKKGLALAKKAVAITMRSINAMIKKAITLAKRATIAFIAISVAATAAALKQEEAEFMLAAQIEHRGENVEKLMKQYKAFASAIQNVTKYGDEEILMIMKTALAMGVSTDKVEDAAKAALALVGIIGGKMKPRMAIRYIAEALAGTTTTLASYITELRNAKTETETFRILNEALARGWRVVTSEAETGFGALKAIWNIIGDIGEAYGEHFLPAFQGMRKWFIENKKVMLLWADAAGTATSAVGTMLFEIANYVVTDFTDAWKRAKDAIVAIFEDLRGRLKDVFLGIFDDYQFNVTDRIAKSILKKATYLGLRATGTGKKEARKGVSRLEDAGYFDPIRPERRPYESTLKETLKDLLPEKLTKPLSDTFNKASEKIQKVLEEIAGLEKEGLKAAKVGPPDLKPGEVTDDGDADKEKKRGKGFGLVGLREAWALVTRGIGGKNPELQTAKNTKETADATKKTAKGVDSLPKKIAMELSRELQNLGTVGT